MNRLTTKVTAASMLSCVMLWAGCGYGEVSPATYEISRALYMICNQQRADKLPEVEALIESHAAQGELTDDEVKWLEQIVTQARDEDWEGAAARARRIMEDQVGS